MTISSSTKSRIMDAAETMFARSGFSGTSIRAICRAAGANQASVHYHFKNKDDLAVAIVERRMVGLATRRRQMLNDLLSRNDILSVRAIIETIVRPLAELIDSEGDAGRAYIKMLVALLQERPDLIWSAFEKYNMENLTLQMAGLSQALPAIDPEVVVQRMTLATSVALLFLAHPLRFAWNGSDIKIEPGTVNLVSEVVDFLAGGVSATSTTTAVGCETKTKDRG